MRGIGGRLGRMRRGTEAADGSLAVGGPAGNHVAASGSHAPAQRSVETSSSEALSGETAATEPSASDSPVAADGRAALTSGRTTRLILTYVEREGGRAAVEELLELTGLEGCERELCDEDRWFTYGAKIRLLEGAATVLGEPLAARRIGAASLDLTVGAELKLAIRAFATVRQVYARVAATAEKLTWAHHWEVLELEDDRARLRYSDVSGSGYCRADCDYVIGLLSCGPQLFGMPPARVRHSVCGVRGADACIYDVRWEARMSSARTAAWWGIASVAAIGAAAMLDSRRLPLAGLVPAVGMAAIARRAALNRSRLRLSLDASVREHERASVRLAASLQDLVADLRPDEVLGKILQNARMSAGGREFALLLADAGESSRGTAGISPATLAALERWAGDTPEVLEATIEIDDLESAPELASTGSMGFGSLCATPLIFRDRHLGVLIALARQPAGFMPQDSTLLEAYAAQAALALAQGEMVERLENLARQDPLTGLLNHREFHDAVERELERCKRYGARMSVVLLDIDGLKRMNDLHGHAEGDRVLRAVAAKIAEAGRAADLACRIGGDEFGLVLPESTAEDAQLVAGRAQQGVQALELGVDLSFGVAQWPDDGPSKDTLLFRADSNLYEAKQSG